MSEKELQPDFTPEQEAPAYVPKDKDIGRNAVIDEIKVIRAKEFAEDEAAANRMFGEAEAPAEEERKRDESGKFVANDPETSPTTDTETIKVDGQEFNVSRDVIEREGGRDALQMKIAAEKRLADAKQIHQQAQEYARQVIAAVEQMKQQRPEPQPQGEVELINQLRYGDEAESAKALRALQDRAAEQAYQRAMQAAQVNPAQMQALIEDRLDHQNSIAMLNRDYRDIVEDPYLSNLAAAVYQQRRQAGDKRKRVEILPEIASELRKWRGSGPTSPAVTSKKEAKASVTVVEPASARMAAQPEQRQPSIDELIERERKRRSGA